MEATGINRESLGWTSIYIRGAGSAHRPGTLASLASVISSQGGNILRSENNTLPDGGFEIRLVVRHIDEEAKSLLRKAYQESTIEITSLELV
jgi:glycine cleavage system regulatory protein